MPDHLHVLAGGASDGADFLGSVKDVKQRSGFAFKRRTGYVLWQPSFHERVLQNVEATEDVMRCIFDNPVRAGLTRDARSWQFSGSDVYRIAEVLEPKA